jgi:hypothetical protein
VTTMLMIDDANILWRLDEGVWKKIAGRAEISYAHRLADWVDDEGYIHPGTEGRSSFVWDGVPTGEPISASTAVYTEPKRTSGERRMRKWFKRHVRRVADATVPKAVEYGSSDLHAIGIQMAVLKPELLTVVNPEELAIAFYLQGKVARLFGAYERGEAPSDDTWFDCEVYSQMAQYVREHGKWGVDAED